MAKGTPAHGPDDDELKKMDDELKKMAAEAVVKLKSMKPPPISTSSQPFNTGYLAVAGGGGGGGSGNSSQFVSSSTSTSLPLTSGTMTIQTSPPYPIATTEEDDLTWEQVIRSAYAWAGMGHADRSQAQLAIAKEIRKREHQQAKMFKKLRKQLELEVANDGDS